MKKPGISLVLSLAFSGLAAVAVGLTLFALERYAERAIERDAGQALQYFARHIADELDHEIYRNYDSLHAYSHLSAFRQNDAAFLRHDLDAYRHIRPVYDWLGVVDAQGVIRVASDGELEGLNVADDPGFRSGLQGNYISEARVIMHDSGEPVRRTARLALEMAVPIHDEAGMRSPYAVLAARLSLDWAARILDEVLVPAMSQQKIETFVVDRQGEFLLTPAGRFDQLPKDLLVNEARLQRWEDGQRYLTVVVQSAGYRDYAGLGWRIVVRQPQAVALEDLARNRIWILLLGALVVLACGLLGWRLSYKISRPLRELTQASEALLAGRAAHLPSEHAYRETQMLARTLAHLLGRLVEEKRKLSELNASLEQQVTQRTRMLEEANEHLVETLAERHELINKLEALARTDPLTGLPNRRAFFERAEIEIHRVERHGTSLNLIAIDIDYFKKINDRYGHDGGDQVLRAFAKTSHTLLRDVDLLARLGGEEFIALLPETRPDAAFMVAERLRQGLAALRISHQHEEICFTVSLGVAEFHPGEALKTWLARADAALYEAKNAGRNQTKVAGSRSA